MARVKILQGVDEGTRSGDSAKDKCQVIYEKEIEFPAGPAGQQRFEVELNIDKEESLCVKISREGEQAEPVKITSKQGTLPPEEKARLIEERKQLRKDRR